MAADRLLPQARRDRLRRALALVGYMRRDLVSDRHWISAQDYDVGLALSQLSPGPLAAQLAIYLGFVHHRIVGVSDPE